uniref:Uncharacterized protein n=1 Tax=Zea mays TaxID=4577 RepID=C4J8L0_MAIZE|nr:unknown [Zea mays]
MPKELLVGMVFNSWSNLRLTAESCYAATGAFSSAPGRSQELHVGRPAERAIL